MDATQIARLKGVAASEASDLNAGLPFAHSEFAFSVICWEACGNRRHVCGPDSARSGD